MTKDAFRKRIIYVSLLTIAAIAVIMFFSITMFNRYSPPNESNTFMTSGTVTDVCHGSPKGKFVIVMASGESLSLEYPWGIQNLYSTIGYNDEQLFDLLVGKTVACRRMKDLPWAVEIHIGDTIIDNTKLTNDQMIMTRAGIVVIALLLLMFLISGDVIYLKAKYQSYAAAKRRQVRKEMRKLKKNQK